MGYGSIWKRNVLGIQNVNGRNVIIMYPSFIISFPSLERNFRRLKFKLKEKTKITLTLDL